LAELLSRITEHSTYQGGLPYLEEDDPYLDAIQLRHGKPLLEMPLLKKCTEAAIAPEPVAGTNTSGCPLAVL
jgi:hypothetical protein